MKLGKRLIVGICLAVLFLMQTGCMSSSYLAVNSSDGSYPVAESLDSEDAAELNYMIVDSLDNLMQAPVPRIATLAVILGLFLLLLFPILYWLLKIVDHREWIWILIPVLAVLFTIGIFLCNRNLRIDKPMAASITICQYETEEGITNASEKTFLSVMLPQAGKQTLSLNRTESTVSQFPVSFDEYGNPSLTGMLEPLPEGTDQIEIETQYSFGRAFFLMESEQTEAECGLKLTMERSIENISGSLTNETGRDLEMVTVYMKDRIIMIGAMKAGETVRFDRAEEIPIQYFSIYDKHIPGVSSWSDEYNRLTLLWEAVMEARRGNAQPEDVFVYAETAPSGTQWFAVDTANERGVDVIVSHLKIPYQDAERIELRPISDYVRYEAYEDVIDFAQEIDYLIPYGHVFAIRRMDQYEEMAYAQVFLYNYQTQSYDQAFTDSNLLWEPQAYFSEEGRIRVRYQYSEEYMSMPELELYLDPDSYNGG